MLSGSFDHAVELCPCGSEALRLVHGALIQSASQARGVVWDRATMKKMQKIGVEHVQTTTCQLGRCVAWQMEPMATKHIFTSGQGLWKKKNTLKLSISERWYNSITTYPRSVYLAAGIVGMSFKTHLLDLVKEQDNCVLIDIHADPFQ